MRTLQLTFDGNMEYMDTTVHEVREALRERLPWVSQLPEDRKMELRKFCRDVESLRRRRQEQRPPELPGSSHYPS